MVLLKLGTLLSKTHLTNSSSTVPCSIWLSFGRGRDRYGGELALSPGNERTQLMTAKGVTVGVVKATTDYDQMASSAPQESNFVPNTTAYAQHATERSKQTLLGRHGRLIAGYKL
jgi:hypothetical protein